MANVIFFAGIIELNPTYVSGKATFSWEKRFVSWERRIVSIGKKAHLLRKVFPLAKQRIH